MMAISDTSRVDRRKASGAATRARILDSAEVMFAERGVEATSLRQVMADADVSISQISYHFGTKLELLRAVFKRRVGPLQERRQLLLDAVEAEPDRPVEDLLRSFLFKLLDDDRSGRALSLRLFSRIYADASPLARQVVAEQFDDYHREFLAILARRYPALSEADLYWRLHLLLCAVVYTPLNSERMRSLSGGTCNPDIPGEVTAGLLPLLTAALEAPPERR